MKRVLAFAALLLFPLTLVGQTLENGRPTKLPGMLQAGIVTREANGIPHVFAFNKHDLYFLNGWLHAQDRLFQMDVTRHIASGTLAEILGSAALPTDVQIRTLGLRRAAEATLPKVSLAGQAALQAYTDGVNAYLASNAALPPEYGLLSLTKVAPWTPTDSLAVGKLLAFGLSFDLEDIDRTIALLTYQGTGQAIGFDGTALFMADTWRSAPFSSAATIPDATGSGAAEPVASARLAVPQWAASALESIRPETIDLARAYLNSIRDLPIFSPALKQELKAGSNEWAIAPKNSSTGNALIANDPHLSLEAPPNFYPISLRSGRTNVIGMGFPGAPFVIQGQNQRIAWGSTVFPIDVTDVYQEQLAPDAGSPSGYSSLYKGTMEHVVAIPETYRVNTMKGLDNIVALPASGIIPRATLIVPRHGPIVEFDTQTGTALAVQYTGFYPTHELEAFMMIDDAQNVDDFKAALQFFDVGAQNFVYGDVDGNIAYFTAAEMPVREDLQAMTVAGAPPYFIRNGQGGNEWMAVKNPQPSQALPYEILPFAEMPQVANPSNGWFVNANNDPLGQTLDGNPLNSLRPGGGIYYLSPGYDGFRAGRITQMIRQKLTGGGKISPEDMKRMQGDTVLLDAEVFVPYIKKALDNAQASGADPALASFGSSSRIQAVVAALSSWDFSTPTGLDNGYDASWIKAPGAAASQSEINNSVAATIYSTWRSRFMANTIDAAMNRLNLPLPPAQQELSALRFQLDNFALLDGKGISGLDFFSVVGVSDPATRRDVVILNSLSDALNLLSSDAFASAFHNSTILSDYRWGRLHRALIEHHMGPLFSPGTPIGPQPGPTTSPMLGLGTDGGLYTVDAAAHDPRATSPDDFTFSHGPNRRYVGDMAKSGINGQSSLPGGVSGYVGSSWYTNLLVQWLTNDTFAVQTDVTPRIPWMP